MLEIFQKFASCGSESGSKNVSPGRALLGCRRERVNDRRVVATQCPRGGGHWSLSQASPPKVTSAREAGSEVSGL